MSSTTHPFAPEEIMAYVDGELSADRAQSLASHVDQCAECRELAASLRNTSQTLSNWTAATAPVNGQFEERLRVAAAKNSTLGESVSFGIFQRTKLWTWKHWTGGLAAAAALGIVLLAIAIPNRLTRPSDFMSLPIHERGRNTVAAGRGFGNGPMGKPQAREEKAMKEVPQAPHQEGDKLHTQSSAEVPIGPYGARPAKAERNLFSFGAVVDQQSRVFAGPMIARTVSLSIVAKDFDAARPSLDAVLARHNGYAAGLNVATPQGAARTLQASLRIPAPQLAAAVAELKALGRVEAETQNGEEVTQQHADLVARLKNSRETEQRLQDVLRTRTGKVKDVLEVEEEIARVRGEIEQMEAEQKNLEHRVDFATIDLKLAEEYKAQLTAPAPSVVMQLRNSIVDGFRTAFQSLLALVLFLAESGPTLLLWLMILSFPAWRLWRRYHRSLATGSASGV
jgi:hypothetical protein